MNYFHSIVIFFSLSGFAADAFASHSFNESSDPRSIVPRRMQTGFSVTEQGYASEEGKKLRRSFTSASLSQEFVDTYRRAFIYHFNHTVDPITQSMLPEDVAKVVPPALINKADILGKFSTKKKEGMTAHILPSVDVNNIDYKQVSLGLLRLGLLIKDAEEFSGSVLAPVRSHLMKLVFLKSAEVSESVIDYADDAEKTDFYTSTGQLYHWSAMHSSQRFERDYYDDKALNHYAKARTYLHHFDDLSLRKEFEDKINKESAFILANRLAYAFDNLRISGAAKL